jgi:glycosyltransferase involved in cell wall biosynthesis
MKLWVSLIVKNEESCLDQCLGSVKAADGIVIVDTGSSDKTPEIARKYTPYVSVGEYLWDDNFAEARNYALDKIPQQDGDFWVLSIDADEVLEEDGIFKIKNAILKSEDKQTVNVRMISSDGSTEHSYPRVFRKGVRWVGIAHETPSISDNNHQDIVIRYGYSEAHKLDPKRMLRILSNAVAKDSSSRNLYYLAREYWYLKEYENAIRIWTEVLEKSSWKAERADTYLMLARCYWSLSRGDEARDVCAKALLINANFKEACLFMAEMSWLENAKQWLNMASSASNADVLFVRSK